MSQQSVRQAARRSALDAQAARRKQRADRERRLEALAIAVLTALGERDALVRDAELRAGQALWTMTDDEGLSVREAVACCGSGVAVREVPRLRQLARDRQATAADERATVNAAARPRADGEQPGDSGGSRWRSVRALGIRTDLPMSGCS
jgi:hypothetical protein